MLREATPTKPSILPPSMSRCASTAWWEPPKLRSFASWNGRMQGPFGLGTQTAGRPYCIGIPSAPGNVPK